MGIMILYICHSNNQLIYTAVVVSPGETVICFDLFFLVELLILLLLLNFSNIYVNLFYSLGIWLICVSVII